MKFSPFIFMQTSIYKEDIFSSTIIYTYLSTHFTKPIQIHAYIELKIFDGQIKYMFLLTNVWTKIDQFTARAIFEGRGLFANQ